MNSPDHISPPAWPAKLLRFFVKEKYLEEIEGDMEELFQDNLEKMSLRQANRIYTWDMLRLLRPVLLKNIDLKPNVNQYGMFKNYFKTAFRGLLKTPLSSFIDIFGLAAAIGICTLV